MISLGGISAHPQMTKFFYRVYSVKPAKGLMKGDLQIFVVKITPPEVKTYKQKLTMRLNDNDKYDQV